MDVNYAGFPHCEQNLVAGARAVPHFEQFAATGVPHPLQNFDPAFRAAPHFAQTAAAVILPPH
jgi:hypothetical protein